MEDLDGRQRAVIEGVHPSVDQGRFAIKRTLGEPVNVTATVFCDGHDIPAAVVQYRALDGEAWLETPMTPLGHDRFRGQFSGDALGTWQYRVVAWVDAFLSWRHDLRRREDPDDLSVALQVGAALVHGAALQAHGDDHERLLHYAEQLIDGAPLEERRRRGLEEVLLQLMRTHAERRFPTIGPTLSLTVAPERARFSAWYELFPRSWGDGHGTFAHTTARLPYVADMGFDVVYLPPIHPIGRIKRKGRNNTLGAGPDDPGSPWAVGAAEGGHQAIHPALGTEADFRQLIERARELNLEVALDLAFQCAPDHPYVREHPEWFRHRPDGTIQYAENPPKRYEDIVPFDFESDAWVSLWQELRGVVQYWCELGVRIFRIDNPHTKPFPFWEWLIAQIKHDYPDVIFLAEAFARPHIMHRLAKLGFDQSYTYFTWRNTKWELSQYLDELTKTDAADYFRPNFWPNTPDILPEYLQYSGRPGFMVRLVLAATLSSSYGIYGPAFELCESRPRSPGSEEYLDSEKYELRTWDLERPDSLKDFIARINRIRRDNPSLQYNRNLRFHPIDNDELIAYSKSSDDCDNIVLTVVNLDPHHTQTGWVELPLDQLGIEPERPYQVHDLITGARHLWHGARNYVLLDPNHTPAHLFRLRRRVRREHDFEYFM